MEGGDWREEETRATRVLLALLPAACCCSGMLGGVAARRESESERIASHLLLTSALLCSRCSSGREIREANGEGSAAEKEQRSRTERGVSSTQVKHRIAHRYTIHHPHTAEFILSA